VLTERPLGAPSDHAYNFCDCARHHRTQSVNSAIIIRKQTSSVLSAQLMGPVGDDVSGFA
jgi:hypothetical protein